MWSNIPNSQGEIVYKTPGKTYLIFLWSKKTNKIKAFCFIRFLNFRTV